MDGTGTSEYRFWEDTDDLPTVQLLNKPVPRTSVLYTSPRTAIVNQVSEIGNVSPRAGSDAIFKFHSLPCIESECLLIHPLEKKNVF